MTFRPPKGNIGKRHQLKYSTEPCGYKHYSCSQPCIENYALCIRHILEDKTAPFKQCNFIYTSTGRRCPLPAPKYERRDSYCSEHVRKVQLRHHKQSGTPQPPLTVERLLSSISHYVKVPPDDKNQKKTHVHEGNNGDGSSFGQDGGSDSSERDNCVVTTNLNPFVDIDASLVNNSLHEVLEYCSESDSDVDVTTIDQTSKNKDEDSSDAESVDSTGEDIFKHANVHTAEEVTLRTREKLTRLQTLYIEQYKRLQHVLKERRRDYIHSVAKERENFCSISSQPKDSVKEQKLYEKLKSLRHYHKRSGVEAILHRKALERRQAAAETSTKPTSSATKCIFSEGGVKCGVKTIPCTKYCSKHVLEDSHQMLFKPCGANKSDAKCMEPVLHVFCNESCVYHYPMPPAQWSYHTRLSSEDEEELKLEVKEDVKDELEQPQTPAISQLDLPLTDTQEVYYMEECFNDAECVIQCGAVEEC